MRPTTVQANQAYPIANRQGEKVYLIYLVFQG